MNHLAMLLRHLIGTTNGPRSRRDPTSAGQVFLKIGTYIGGLSLYAVTPDKLARGG